MFNVWLLLRVGVCQRNEFPPHLTWSADGTWDILDAWGRGGVGVGWGGGDGSLRTDKSWVVYGTPENLQYHKETIEGKRDYELLEKEPAKHL